MNRFVQTALAFAVAGSAVNAGTGDNEWSALDSEIRGLASPLRPSEDGMGWSALVRAVYSYSRDDISTGADPSDADTSGFKFNDVDLAFWGATGPYSWRVSADLDGNGFEFDSTTNQVSSVSSQLWLEDAYVRWGCGEYFDAMMGNFKPRVTRSNSVDPEKQVLIDRTAIGASFDSWDLGVGVNGSFETFHWWAALMNGFNGHTRDHAYVLRGEFDLGSGAGQYEGAMGSSDALNATIGLSLVANDTLDEIALDVNGDLSPDFSGGGSSSNNRNWFLDVNGSVSNFGFGFEVAELDDDYIGFTDEDYGKLHDASTSSPADDFPFLFFLGDSNPWNVTVSYLIAPELEVAARYEDLDNDSGSGPDNTVLSVGLNWYRDGGAGKWQAQWTRVKADDRFGAAVGQDYNEGDYFEIGFAVGATR
jgi:hypothetical protein